MTYQRPQTLTRPDRHEYLAGAHPRYHRTGPRWAASAGPLPDLRRLPLDDEVASVYLYALRRGWIENCPDAAAALGLQPGSLDEAIGRLVRLRLLRSQPREPHRFTPLDPDVAAASLISPLEAEIHRRRDLITNIREQMSVLLPRYEEACHGRQSPSYLRLLSDAKEAEGCLSQAVGACREEVLVARPRNAAWDSVVDEALVRNLSARQREVRVRVLHQHSVRGDLAARAAIRRMVAGGVEVRTTSHLSRPLLVIDQEIVFTPDPCGALEVGNAQLARLLADVFDDIWSAAMPYRAVEAGYRDAVDEIQKTIARLLAEGRTDEVVARRLGMSLRSCRRHIAALLKNLDATSRFQAGAHAAKAGLIAE